MKITGAIQTKKRVRDGNTECSGTCSTRKRSFSILIANAAYDDPEEYADTLLHELMHLWFEMLAARLDKKISQKIQHEVIEKIVPMALYLYAKSYNRRHK